MPARHRDWLKQAGRDLAHAEHSRDFGDFDWACFAAQQAAEKAVKALHQKLNSDAWGHSVTALLEALPPQVAPEQDLLDCARRLDKHYVPARYPNGFPSGAPVDYYTRDEAERSIDDAGSILEFCTRETS